MSMSTNHRFNDYLDILRLLYIVVYKLNILFLHLKWVLWCEIAKRRRLIIGCCAAPSSCFCCKPGNRGLSLGEPCMEGLDRSRNWWRLLNIWSWYPSTLYCTVQYSVRQRLACPPISCALLFRIAPFPVSTSIVIPLDIAHCALLLGVRAHWFTYRDLEYSWPIFQWDPSVYLWTTEF